jgi:hypothetical protein
MDTRKEEEKGLPELWKKLRELSINKKLKSLSLQNCKLFDSTSCIPLDDEGGLLDFRKLARSIIDDIFDNLKIWTSDYQAVVAAEIESTIQIDAAAEIEAAVQTDAAAEIEAAVQTDAAAQIEAAVQTDVAAQIEAAVQTDVAAQIEAAVQTDVAEIEADVQTDVAVQTDAAVQTDVAAQIEAADVSEIVDITDDNSDVESALDIISKTLYGISGCFGKIVHSLINTKCFDLETVLYFLKEIAIFAELMISHNGFGDFPVVWQIFQDLAIQQVTTFEVFMDTKDYTQAHELLWLLVKVTNYQKDFLNKCVEETLEYKHLMDSCALSWKRMLNIEEDFFLKLIEMLQASKNVQICTIPNSMEC